MNHSKLKPTNWLYVFIAYLTLFCLGLLDNARGPFYADILHDLQLNNWQGSMFYATASFMAYVTGDRVAHWSRRFGTLNVLRLGQILMVIGFAAIPLAHQLMPLLMYCAIFGLGFGVLNVAQNLLILEASFGALQRRLFSGLHGMYAFSSLVAPLICAHFFRAGQSWRSAFLLFAALASVAFFVSLVARNHKLPKKIESEATQGEVESSAEESRLFQKYFWAVMMVSFYVISEVALSTRFSLYLRSEKGYSAELAATYLAGFFVSMFVGRLVFFLFQFHWRTGSIIFTSLVLSMILFSMGLVVHPVFLILCGLSMAPVFGLSLAYLAEIYPHSAHQVVSYTIAKSCLLIVAAHIFTGLFSDLFGVGRALAMAPIYILVSLLSFQRLSRLPVVKLSKS
jgi:fucose permease